MKSFSLLVYGFREVIGKLELVFDLTCCLALGFGRSVLGLVSFSFGCGKESARREGGIDRRRDLQWGNLVDKVNFLGDSRKSILTDVNP